MDNPAHPLTGRDESKIGEVDKRSTERSRRRLSHRSDYANCVAQWRRHTLGRASNGGEV